MKFVTVPSELTGSPYYQNIIAVNGFSVVESCTHTSRITGSMFLEDHMLLYVSKGISTMMHGNTEYRVGANEMLLLKKSTLVEYVKTGDPDQGNCYDSMIFFLKDEFLQDFLKLKQIETGPSPEPARMIVKPVKERLRAFFESIKPYFNEPGQIDPALMRLKMLELFFDITATDQNFMLQILQLKKPYRANLSEVMENNFASPVTLDQLAYLSGRSLSSFKRDFQAIYNSPPAEWIRARRLHKAAELLSHSRLSVTDVAYTLGFKSVAHFSRAFKEFHGASPTENRKLTEKSN